MLLRPVIDRIPKDGLTNTKINLDVAEPSREVSDNIIEQELYIETIKYKIY